MTLGIASPARNATLTREQQAALDGILANLNRRHFQSLGGFAGTGKTFLLRHLYDEICRTRGWQVGVCAPTGKAANVLRAQGLDQARTMHSLAYRCVGIVQETRKDEDGNKYVFREHPVFQRKDAIDYDFVIVDEASMVNRHHFEDLLSYGVPLLFVGDHGQLPPVGQHQVHLMGDPDWRLETIHRNAGPIAKFCGHVRDGNLPRQWEGNGDAVLVLRKGQRASIKDWLDTQVICGLNRTRVQVNGEFRRLLGRTLPVEPGDRLVSLRNSPDHGLWNGTQGTVMDVVSPGQLVLSVDGRPVATSCNEATLGQVYPVGHDDRRHPFDYAYALTCHKAQGDQYARVTVLDESAFMGRDNPDNIRRWRYTAASRARHFLRWVC